MAMSILKKGILKTNFNRKSLTEFLSILENDANNNFQKTFYELNADKNLSDQLINYIES